MNNAIRIAAFCATSSGWAFYPPAAQGTCLRPSAEVTQEKPASSLNDKHIIILTFNSNEYRNFGSSSTIGPDQELAELLSKLPWVSDFLKTARELNSPKQLLPYYKNINRLIYSKQFALCDLFLSKIKSSQLSNVLLVGIVRMTSQFKSDLPSWQILFDDVVAEIEKRELNSAELLRGLA